MDEFCAGFDACVAARLAPDDFIPRCEIDAYSAAQGWEPWGAALREVRPAEARAEASA